MDPNANLKEQLGLAEGIIDIADGLSHEELLHDALRLAELVQALDAWIVRGGFVPERWQIRNRKED